MEKEPSSGNILVNTPVLPSALISLYYLRDVVIDNIKQYKNK